MLAVSLAQFTLSSLPVGNLVIRLENPITIAIDIAGQQALLTTRDIIHAYQNLFGNKAHLKSETILSIFERHGGNLNSLVGSHKLSIRCSTVDGVSLVFTNNQGVKGTYSLSNTEEAILRHMFRTVENSIHGVTGR